MTANQIRPTIDIYYPMKKQFLFSTLLIFLLFACDEPHGYYDPSQQDVINNLTRHEWFQYYSKMQGFDSSVHDEGWIYQFSSNGKGHRRWCKSDGTPIDGPSTEYFQWTFTNDNFTVIYLGGNIERFWLIDKLDASELWVYDARIDPVINPNTDKTHYRFKAIGKPTLF